MSTRIVTLYSTKGGKQKVETDATTWGELKPLVEEHYDLSNLQPTENVNKTTLTHQEAVLPEGAFVLFLRPVKTKSGIEGVEDLGFKELRALVKQYKESDGDGFLEHINADGNYTRLSTDALREKLASYQPAIADTPVITEEVVEESQEVETTDEVACVPTPLNPLEKAETVKKLLSEICDETEDDDVCDRIEDIEGDVDGLISDLQDIYSPEAAEKRRQEEAALKAEEEENERLQNEFEDFNDGF